jgi:hypothetical protein
VSDPHRQSLEMRRRELVERSAAQRAALRATVLPLVHKVESVDRALASVRRYPMIAAGIAGVVTLFGSKKLFSLLARGVTLYTLLRKI